MNIKTQWKKKKKKTEKKTEKQPENIETALDINKRKDSLYSRFIQPFTYKPAKKFYRAVLLVVMLYILGKTNNNNNNNITDAFTHAIQEQICSYNVTSPDQRTNG